MSVIPAPEMSDPLPPLDALASQRLCVKTSRAGQPWLHNEVASRMAQRLDLIRHPVHHWVHWAPRLGGLASQDLLEQAFPQARCSVVQNEVADVLWASRALQQAWWKKCYFVCFDSAGGSLSFCLFWVCACPELYVARRDIFNFIYYTFH